MELVEIELQEGSGFELVSEPNGVIRIRLPRVSVERALLKAGTSYPVLVRNAERDHARAFLEEVARSAEPYRAMSLDSAELMARPPHLTQEQADKLDELVVQERTDE